MVSVIRCWKAEYQKCKHSILLYMHSMIPIICAAVFAGYYYISSWEPATKISAYLEVLAVAFPFLIGIIVGLVVQIENQAGHYQLLLGTIPSRIAKVPVCRGNCACKSYMLIGLRCAPRYRR